MRRLLCIFVSAACVAGCADGRFHKKSITGGACPGTVSGYTYTGIVYGESHLVVIPLSKIRAGTEWRFYLLPTDRPRGSSASALSMRTVTVDGKPAGPAPPPGANQWIFTAGDFSGGMPAGNVRYISQCVPATLNEGDEFQYLVDVEGIGTLDPRARVEK